MSRPNRKPGDYIPLSWGCDDPDYEVVRGHVSADAMREALVAYYCGAEHVPDLSGEPRHAYGMWCFDGVDEWGNGRRVLRMYREPGRGRFAVTVWDVVGVR